MTPTGAPILDYHRPTDAEVQPRWLAGVWLLVNLPLAVVPFVSFTYGTSPLDVVAEFGTRFSRFDFLALILIGFWSNRQLGWWLTAISSAGLIAELLLVFLSTRRRLAN